MRKIRSRNLKDRHFLITSFASFGHFILSVLYITTSDYIFRIFWLLYIVCPSLYYGFWLHLSHLLVIIYCLSFFKLRLLITSFASFGHYILSVLLYITASDYIFRKDAKNVIRSRNIKKDRQYIITKRCERCNQKP
jgi:hypothetical protein